MMNKISNCNKYVNIICNILIVLILASCAARKSPAPVVEVKGSTPLSKKIKNSIKSTEYIIGKGETLYSIAWRSGIDVRSIAKLNRIKSPYKIFPGQKLILVKKVAQPNRNKRRSENIQNRDQKVVKKPVAHNKKQAYGNNVVDKKTEVGQKVRRWLWPTKGKIITNFSSGQPASKGIDIAGKRGQPILSAADGKVVYVGDALSGYGKLIIVKHNEDYLSAYAHNDRILVKEQQTIKAGDVIAKMGSTDAERVMLHFEVRFRGKSVNPLKYLTQK
jgi:lipoprotein NlpD